MTIEAIEKRFFGLRERTRVVSDREVFSDPKAGLGFTVISPDEIDMHLIITGISTFSVTTRKLAGEEINRFFTSDIPGKTLGSGVRLSWRP